MTKFAEILIDLLEEKSLKKSDLASMTEIPYTTIDNWIKKDSYPNVLLALKLAEFFDVSIDFLIFGKEKEKISFTKDDFSLMKKIKELTQVNRMSVESVIDSLHAAQSVKPKVV